MPTYAIGDIHGCYQTLRRLLDRIEFSTETDRLWLAGDLVNRGSRSLDVLRWAREHDSCITAVLGNHDLHLLGRAAGVRQRKEGDTVDEILRVPDRHELLDWLRHRPLFHREDEFVLVHAGLLPKWTFEDAVSHARQLASALQGPGYRETLASIQTKKTRVDGAEDAPAIDWREIASVFTRLRYCTTGGDPAYSFTGPPEDAPAGQLPWFAVPGSRNDGATVLFGHWAALGLRIAPGIAALDSGCAWGGPLTAVRLPDLAVFQEPNADGV